jgi:hypothetical protein
VSISGELAAYDPEGGHGDLVQDNRPNPDADC